MWDRVALACVGLLMLGCGSEPDGTTGGDGGAGSGGGSGGSASATSSGGSSGSSGSGGSAASGGSGAASGGSGPVTPDPGELFPTLPPNGTVTVTLHPSGGAPSGSPVVVAFGLPLPRGAVSDVSTLRVLDGSGSEIASHVEELVRWQSLATPAPASTVRAALIYVERTFAGAPLEIQVEYGATRALELGAQPPARSSWVSVSDEYPASANVKEPIAYATLPPEWLSACLLRSRSTVAGADPAWKWFDDFYAGAGRTAVNDVDPGVTELIDYETDYEPWLFDRSMTLFGLYVRTGDVKWLRHAHRSAQFYASHLDGSGSFDLKGEDLKYSYGQSLLVDLMLTGDVDLLDPIERVATAAAKWNATYQPSSNFWTERHQTYALLGALSAFEATGKSEHADRAREVAKASFSLAKSPVGGWANDGCMLHEFDDHEGAGGSQPVCSPWMSALFADAAFRYYLYSEDPEALEFLVSLGQYVAQHGVYEDTIDGQTRMLPWYLSSSVVQFSDSGPYADIEHTCDVASIVARAAWAQKALGQDPSGLRATASSLVESCEANLDNWYRPEGPASGKSVWRLSPPRKFNWWFGATLDLAWMMAQSAP